MNIKEAKEILDHKVLFGIQKNVCIGARKAVETVLKELDKKDKIIDEMAEYIKDPYQIYINKSRTPKIKAIEQYFEKKVEDKSC